MSNFVTKMAIVPLLIVGMAGVAQATLVDTDGTPWATDFDGFDQPDVTSTFVAGGGSFNYDDKFTNGDINPGWMTANGAGGGTWTKAEFGNTKAGGWTVEWGVTSHPGFAQALSQNIVTFNDDTSLLRVDYEPSTNTVTLRDGIPPAGGGTSSSVSVDLFTALTVENDNVYRLVRQAGSDTVELYVNNDFSSPAAQITPAPAVLPYADAGNLNNMNFGFANFEAAWDFFRYRSGANPAIPEPASLTLLSFGVLMMVLRRRR